MNAGTIKHDGRIRSTAVVIDTRQFAPTLKGVILASAAHVIYDLEKKRPFKRCEFHFLALSEISRYRVKIDLKQLRMGSFDPGKAVNEPGFGVGDWVFLYVPRPWKRFNLNEALLPRVFSFTEFAAFQQTGGELRLIAYDTTKKVMSVSRYCTVIQSQQGDLGGGAWQGQLLDDCDSASGVSGGGLIAVLQGKHYLVGIRNGSRLLRAMLLNTMKIPNPLSGRPRQKTSWKKSCVPIGT